MNEVFPWVFRKFTGFAISLIEISSSSDGRERYDEMDAGGIHKRRFGETPFYNLRWRQLPGLEEVLRLSRITYEAEVCILN